MRSTTLVDIREIIRQLKMGQSQREIARCVGIAHKTVARYQKLAVGAGWLTRSELPEAKEIGQTLAMERGPLPSQNRSGLDPLGGVIQELYARGVEDASVMHERLKAGHGYQGSYSAVWRYMRSNIWPEARQATVRMHSEPGEEAQVDFGDVGLMWDPVQERNRKAYAFIMTLSWSRHQFVCHVFSQKSADWLACHMRAFEHFGGVPKRIVLDNLKAGVTQASFDNPELNRAYRALAEHYGFVIAPCRPGEPQHKGKVEAGVKFYKRNALAGRAYDNAVLDVHAADDMAHAWVMERAGQRIHGTTRQRPLEQFEQTERAALSPLPVRRFERLTFKQVRLHRDCHVVFDYSHYSVPSRLIGQQVWVRASDTRVEILHQDAVVAVHTRAQEGGTFVTDPAHFPKHKGDYVRAAQPAEFRARAAVIGPYTQKVIAWLSEQDVLVDHRHAAARLVQLADKHSPELLERACRAAVEDGDPRPSTVRVLLKLMLTGWKGDLAQAVPVSARPPKFARSAAELVPHGARVDPSLCGADGTCQVSSLLAALDTPADTASTPVTPHATNKTCLSPQLNHGLVLQAPTLPS